MNNNPIDELRDLKVPVSEQEWEAIIHDKRYVKKFGRKSGMSPKGRAALIAGAAVALLTVPILFLTLSHKTADTAQDNKPVAQTEAMQPESVSETAPTVSPVTQETATASKPEATLQALPSASGTTSRAATHEQSTLSAVAEARVPANSQPATTIKPAASVTTPQVAETVSSTPKNTSSTTVSNSKKTQPDVANNRPPTANTIVDDNPPTVEKSLEETLVESEEFFIPTAFTPNGDGLNDMFKVQANFVPNTFEMSIFNRKGELMFLSQDMGIGWDGQFHGQTLPSGVYVCIIKYTDSEGKMQKKQGQVMLLP